MSGRKAPRGYVLLVAIVMTTLLSITLALTIQPVMTASTRMKERQLVYRGEHLAAGIRAYYYRYGRFPFDLEELVESEPPLVRKLYADPMTESGAWTLVYLTREDMMGVRVLRGQASRLNAETEVNSETEADADQPGLSRSMDSVFRIRDRQITGIRSQSDAEGLRVYQDSRIYRDWLFSALPEKQLTIEGLIEDANPRRPGRVGN